MNTEKEAQFLQLLERNQARIRKLCTMYAHSSEDRKDLEQEVTLNIWKSFTSFRGEAKIDTWLFQIILNVCLKHTYAIKRGSETVSLERLNFEPSSNTAENREDFQDLKHCIQSLAFGDKTIIILYLEELPYSAIGKIVGITENHVAVKVKRIKNKLFKCLAKIKQNG